MLLIIPDWLTPTTRMWSRAYAWFLGYRWAQQKQSGGGALGQGGGLEEGGLTTHLLAAKCRLAHLRDPGVYRTDTGKYDDDIPGDYLYSTNIYWWVAAKSSWTAALRSKSV